MVEAESSHQLFFECPTLDLGPEFKLVVWCREDLCRKQELVWFDQIGGGSLFAT